ncbi:hypothetical protein J4221_01635 [Candidatus Pacearchaeota archaeon]|nr:hypothetical protein [Candidatus Pacearchaeota archaeon]
MTKKKDIDDKKIKAFIASFFTIIGFLIAIIIWKKDDYVMFYAKQGLILFIGQLIIIILDYFMIKWFTFILWAFWIILWVLTWINALSGQKKDTFIVSDLSKKIKL